MPSARVLRSIEEAVRGGRLVKVTRRKGWDRLDGAIVSSSPKWLLLAIEHDAGFDRHALVRVGDVRRVEPFPSETFIRRALENEGSWPLPRLDGVDLSSTRAALRTLAERAALLAIYDEQDHPDEILIGRPSSYGRKKFRLETVNPEAGWDPEDATFRYRSVSRIDVGDGYQRRLSAVAGPPPTR